MENLLTKFHLPSLIAEMVEGDELEIASHEKSLAPKVCIYAPLCIWEKGGMSAA